MGHSVTQIGHIRVITGIRNDRFTTVLIMDLNWILYFCVFTLELSGM